MTTVALLVPDLEGADPAPAVSVEWLVATGVIGRVVVATTAGADAPAGAVATAAGPGIVATVERALDAAGPCEVAVVHSIEQPPVDRAFLVRLLADLREHRCDAVVAAAPVTDTLKRVDGEGRIVETLPRGEIWRLQTPQAYRVPALRRALARARERVDAGEGVPTRHALLPACVDGRVRITGIPLDTAPRLGPTAPMAGREPGYHHVREA